MLLSNIYLRIENLLRDNDKKSFTLYDRSEVSHNKMSTETGFEINIKNKSTDEFCCRQFFFQPEGL